MSAQAGFESTGQWWAGVGGRPECVYLCDLGCLVLESRIAAHRTLAHP